MEPLMQNVAPITDEERKPRSKAVPIIIVILAILFVAGFHLWTKVDSSPDTNANPPAVVAPEDSSELSQDMPEGAAWKSVACPIREYRLHEAISVRVTIRRTSTFIFTDAVWS